MPTYSDTNYTREGTSYRKDMQFQEQIFIIKLKKNIDPLFISKSVETSGQDVPLCKIYGFAYYRLRETETEIGMQITELI